MSEPDTSAVKEKLRALLLKKKGISVASTHRLVRRRDSGPALLSFAQQRLWVIDELLGTTAEYNLPQTLRLRGALDHAALERAINTIIERHDSLRTHFAEMDGEPVQIIAPELSIRLSVEDLSGLDETARQKAVAAALSRDVEMPFDLRRGPMLRARLLRTADREHVLLLVFHHIVTDIWSMGVFDHELAVLYTAFREGRENPLEPLPVQYADFAEWQRKCLDEEVMRQGLDYWKRQLAGAPERLDLPTDRPRPKMQTFVASDHAVTVPADHVMALKELGQQDGATLYMSLLAAFAVLLQRHSGQDDIVVGSPIANRQETQLEQLIGFFVNSLVMRVRVDPRACFRDLLADVRELARDAFQQQDIPFEKLVEEMSPERSLSSTPMFQVTFALQNAPGGAQHLEGLDIEPIAGGEMRVRFDLEVYAFEHDAGLELLWLYNRDLFDHWRIENMARDFVALLESAVAAPGAPIYRLGGRTVPPAEHAVSHLADGDVPSLFAETAKRNPEFTAIVCGSESLSYESLNTRANQLAHHLIALGVQPETFVGVCLDRSIELIVASLAILKAGGVYVPIAPDLPEKRRNELVAEAWVRHLVTPETFGELAHHSEEDPCVALLPEHPAYVNFTSGSTGIPKGVLVPHAAIVRLVRAPNYVHLDAASRILQLAPLSFDAATFEIWGALLNGGVLVVVPAGVVSPEVIADIVTHQRINTVWLTSGLFTQMVDHALPAFAGVRQLLAGGDVLSPEHVREILRAHPQCRFINGYGPTENTTFSCCCTVSADTDLTGGVPIGVPINETSVRVLDAALEPVPLGVRGELYVTGTGLARGYLHQPALTAERFVADPFEPGMRMYRTGDLVRQRRDGNLEFLGRSDQQIKLRGFRIEPGEIEAALREDERVQDALVTVREQGDQKQLLAYVIGAEDTSSSRIQEWQELYDSTYGEGAESAGDFNITGWHSSYTGDALAADDMRIWVDETEHCLRALRPRRVLEVGCGTGLLLTRLAPDCESYIGLDFSAEVITQLDRHRATQADLKHVELRQGLAHDLTFLADGAVDLVVLNSIVQYFPNVNYLLDVLAEAVRVTRRGGHVFVGDVRSLPLLRAFHTSVQLFQAAPETSLETLRQQIEQAQGNEGELVVAPSLFNKLQFGRCEVSLKAGAYDNELSRFRYDVTLTLGEPELPDPVERWIAWDRTGDWRIALEDALASRPDEPVGVRGLPDARVANAIEAVRLLDATGCDNVEELRASIGQAPGEDPDSVIRLARHLGVGLSWQRFEADGVYETIFNPRWQPSPRMVERQRSDYQSETNVPRESGKSAELGLALKALLEHALPDYMVPAAVVVLPSWPLTSSGKVDRAALPVPGRHERAGTAYRAPRTPEEETLCGLFAEILHLDRVSIDDRFFALGGDSIMSIQLVSRARREGLDLTPRHVFEHQTVEALGAIGRRHDRVARPQYDEAASVGDVPLTPVIHWFVERCGVAQRFHQSMLVEVAADLTEADLLVALQAVIDAHDVLRLRLLPDGMRIEPRGAVPASACLTSVSEFDEATIHAVEDRLDASEGRVLQVLWCGSQLAVMIHHLAVDGVSWRILIPDLMAALSVARSGTAPVLDPVGTPFRVWAEHLAKQARCPAVLGELPAWEAILDSAGPLVPGAALDPTRDTVASAEQLVVTVPPELTSALLTTVPAAFHAGVNDVLLTALAVAITSWRAEPVLIDLEGHGRESTDPDIDLSRTVGWFTSIFPVALDTGGAEAGCALKRIKEQLRAVPGEGLGFGLLRYMNPETGPRLAALSAAQIGFNYLGRFSANDSKTTGLGGGADPSMPLGHLLEINAQTADGPDGPTLTATWTWGAAHLSADEVQVMADAWLHALEELVRDVETGAGGHTPSDFPLLTLSQSEVERIESAHPGIEDILPLSPLQEGLVLHAFYDDAAHDVYTVQVCIELDGPLDTPRLETAARTLLRRHANLRAAVYYEGLELPVQVVLRDVELPWCVVDACTNRDEVLAAEHAKRFVLTEAPLLRLALLKLAPERHLLALTNHHLLMDGWSMPIFFGELLALYRSGGDESPLPRVRPYSDYLRWLASQDDDAAIAAWREYLADLEGTTSLVSGQNTKAAALVPENCRDALSEDLTARLETFARSRGLTLNTIIQGLWAVLLARLTGCDDVVFGVTSSGRPAELPGIEQMVGLFINALPLRVRLDTEEPMDALLTRIQNSQSRMMSYQHVGLGSIQRAAGTTDLFDTLLVYENYPMDHAEFNEPNHGLRMSAAEGRDAVQFPVSLLLVPGEQLSLRMRYDPLVISTRRAQAMLDQIKSLAAQLVEKPQLGFRDYSLIAGDAVTLLPDPREELAEPEMEPVTAVIARLASRQPNHEAVSHAGRSWTYAELMNRAEAIAQQLLAQDLKRGEVVGIEGRRSFETVASMLGAMMSGAAVLTLDPDLPQQRRELMLEMCRVRIVLGEHQASPISGQRPLPRLSPEDPACVFFTSGSTGIPKAVLGWHKTISHFIQWEGGAFDVGPEDRVAQLIHMSFDPMLRDVFLPLTFGGTLCLPEKDDVAGGEHLIAWMRREKITIAHSVPSLAQWWMQTAPKGQSVPTLRWTLFSGEPLMGELVRQWRAAFSPIGGVVNLYGQIETLLAKCAYRVPPDPDPGLQPVGWPLPQMQVLVITPAGKLCGIGEVGEVVLRTPFLSLGYIGTDGGVLPPWKPNPLGANDPVYFTGDAGRYLPDGALEIVGRLDDQVKIRGVRVDPTEIAAVLLGHAKVAECIVMVRGSESDKRLVAYVVGTAAGRALIAYAAERLPASMVPASVVILPAMPLTPNGKVDRRVLPDPAVEQRECLATIAPRDSIELHLGRLWKEILGIEAVGMRDDFFDLGGYSLPALRLVNRIALELGVKLSAAAVFRHRTVEELAAAMRVKVPWSPIVPIQAGGSRTPLFCVHPQGGLALGYTEFARCLGADQPFYGLQSIGLEEGQEPLTSIEAMAALYIDAIRRILPDGPYLLAGYSAGGRVAYEMAQVLRREGSDVPLLALLDSGSPANDGAMMTDIDDAQLLLNLVPDDIGISIEELRRLDADEQLSAVVRKAHEHGLVPPDFDAEGMRRFLRVYKSNITAGQLYRLQPYDGKITLLQTEERAANPKEDPRQGWGKLAMDGIEVHVVPGTHMTLMQPPAVTTLAERLRECLENNLSTD